VHLHAERRHLAADVGAERLGNRGQERRPRRVGRVAGGRREVDRHGAVERDRPRRGGQRRHGREHPPHVGVAEQAGLVRDRRHALAPVVREGEGSLERRLGDADALHPHSEAGVVHHGEHRRHAAARRADQPAGRTLEGHDAGRAAVQAELVLERHDAQPVGDARPPGLVRQPLRHDEQRQPARALRRVRQPRQHEVADVRRHVVVAPADEDLLPGDREGPVRRRLGPGPHRADVGPGLRLGQVHRPGPFPRGEPRQVERPQPVVGVALQRLDLALRQERADRQREVGARHHLVDAGHEDRRQPEAAVRRIGRHADPAAVGEGAVGVGEAGARAHHAVLQPRRVQVAGPARRRERRLGEARGLGQDRLGGRRRRLGEARGGGDPARVEHAVEQEAHLGDWGAVAHGDPPGDATPPLPAARRCG
jgi:hypothetical protein